MPLTFLRVQMIAVSNGEFTDDYHRKYTQTWQVEVDDPTACEEDIWFAPGLPQIRSSFAVYGIIKDAYAFAKAVRPSRPDRDDPWLWHVEIEYSTRTRDPERENTNPNDPPTAKPLLRKWGKQVTQKVLDPDRSPTPKPVQNTAKQPYNPAPTYERRLQTLVITRNEATFDKTRAKSMMDTVNQNEFYGTANQGNWRCMGVTGDEKYEKGVRFWEVVYEFLHDSDGHHIKLRNQGTVTTRDSAGNTIAQTQITDQFGAPVNGPVDLDANGGVLPPGSPPIYNDFVGYPPYDYAPLNLDP